MWSDTDFGKKDEVVLLCDCGGGTVVSATSVEVRRTAHSTKDIIVYKIVNKDPLELDEVCVGSGECTRCSMLYGDSSNTMTCRRKVRIDIYRPELSQANF